MINDTKELGTRAWVVCSGFRSPEVKLSQKEQLWGVLRHPKCHHPGMDSVKPGDVVIFLDDVVSCTNKKFERSDFGTAYSAVNDKGGVDLMLAIATSDASRESEDARRLGSTPLSNGGPEHPFDLVFSYERVLEFPLMGLRSSLSKEFIERMHRSFTRWGDPEDITDFMRSEAENLDFVGLESDLNKYNWPRYIFADAALGDTTLNTGAHPYISGSLHGKILRSPLDIYKEIIASRLSEELLANPSPSSAPESEVLSDSTGRKDPIGDLGLAEELPGEPWNDTLLHDRHATTNIEAVESGDGYILASAENLPASDAPASRSYKKRYDHHLFDRLDEIESLSGVRLTTFRKEQASLRSMLFKQEQNSRCCICGKDLPTDLLVAAHLKPRSRCSSEEQRDYQNIVAPMCKLGCDDLYERGYIHVVDGRVVAGKTTDVTPDLQAYIDTVVGSECFYWREESAKYFLWHYDSYQNPLSDNNAKQ